MLPRTLLTHSDMEFCPNIPEPQTDELYRVPDKVKMLMLIGAPCRGLQALSTMETLIAHVILHCRCWSTSQCKQYVRRVCTQSPQFVIRVSPSPTPHQIPMPRDRACAAVCHMQALPRKQEYTGKAVSGTGIPIGKKLHISACPITCVFCTAQSQPITAAPRAQPESAVVTLLLHAFAIQCGIAAVPLAGASGCHGVAADVSIHAHACSRDCDAACRHQIRGGAACMLARGRMLPHGRLLLPAVCLHTAHITGHQSIGRLRGGKQVCTGQPGPHRPTELCWVVGPDYIEQFRLLRSNFRMGAPTLPPGNRIPVLSMTNPAPMPAWSVTGGCAPPALSQLPCRCRRHTEDRHDLAVPSAAQAPLLQPRPPPPRVCPQPTPAPWPPPHRRPPATTPLLCSITSRPPRPGCGSMHAPAVWARPRVVWPRAAARVLQRTAGHSM